MRGSFVYYLHRTTCHVKCEFFSKSACKTVALTALMSVGLVACDQTAETTEMSLDSQEQRISYGIAMNMGRRMKAEGVPIDADAFAEDFAMRCQVQKRR